MHYCYREYDQHVSSLLFKGEVIRFPVVFVTFGDFNAFLKQLRCTLKLYTKKIYGSVLPKKSSVKNDYLTSYKKQFGKKRTLLIWFHKSCKRNIVRLLRDRKVYKPVIMKITWYTKSFRKNDYETDGCPTQSL